MKDDMISRREAIDVLEMGEEFLNRVLDETDVVGAEREKYEWGLGLIESYISDMKDLPSAQPERLTDDDFETIRIHLNAYKEKLCNQWRWEEAKEYQRIIDRFMAFASAQPEIIRCKDCKHFAEEGMYCSCDIMVQFDHFYCYYAERKEDD